ncbi:MAG: DUF192 domain-containing protein [Chloroflexi bacterium]|nr:DUF192 domain-containing protein [Chloroflexota bacterium]
MFTLRTAVGAPIADRVRSAAGFWGRFRGLMGHPGLAPDEGLVLATNSIHMLFMRFPIDALFLGAPDATGHQRVVAIRQDLRPWTGVVWYVRGAAAVVELPAGTCARAGVAVGDSVHLDPAGAPTTEG